MKHVSALQRNKEASRAAGSESPTSRVRTPSRAETAARCATTGTLPRPHTYTHNTHTRAHPFSSFFTMSSSTCSLSLTHSVPS